MSESTRPRKDHHIQPPSLSRHTIIREAEDLTKRFARVFGLKPPLLAINFDLVYEHVIYPEYEICLVEDQDLGHCDDGAKILGIYEPLSNTVYIDETIGPTSGDARRTFTLWHEVGGHGILQGNWLRAELNRLRRSSAIITTEESLDKDTSDTLEQQANLFAAYSAAPTWLLNYAIKTTFDVTRPIRYIGRRKYCLDVRHTTRFYDVENFNELCRIIAHHIKWLFGGLSTEALSYRVERSPLVVDESREFTARAFRLRRTARGRRPFAPIAASWEMTVVVPSS